jgi:hypothetical protein
MDKYLHLRLIQDYKRPLYDWFGYHIAYYYWLDKPWVIYWGMNPMWALVVPMSLNELDEKLEQLWQKHQSKSEVEA